MKNRLNAHSQTRYLVSGLIAQTVRIVRGSEVRMKAEKRCDNCVWQYPTYPKKELGEVINFSEIEWRCVNEDSPRYWQKTADDEACEFWK